MSTVVETIERTTLVRSFELPLAESWDGRTLDTRIVPYDEPTTVADPPDFTPYQEVFRAGAFRRQLSTPGRDRVWLNVEHEQGFRGAIGRSLRFDDREDGLHGSFGVLENADGDKALELINEGFLTGVSLEFRELSSRRVNGVVERVRAHLDKVSLCRFPAYAGAGVLAVREEPDEPEAVFVLPDLSRSTAVDERLTRLGYVPLETALAQNELTKAAKALLRSRRTPEAAAEARKLIRQYQQAGLDVPAGLRQLAASA